MKKIIIFLSILLLSSNKQIKYCDIKGNVNNPGVYEIKDNYTIQDIINESGGLKRNSYIDNINLSKKVEDEMVIYINKKSEIDKIKSLNNCDCSPIYEYIECVVNNEEENVTSIIIETPKITTTKIENILENNNSKDIIFTEEKLDQEELEELININTCTVEELTNIKGLGNKKAIKIIEYRNEFGLFENIEDIKNVSGIGDATFEQIKDYIKV